MKITHVTPDNANEIYSIASNYQLKNFDDKSVENEGFLIFVKSVKEYQQIIAQASLSMQIRENDEMVGYMTAYTWTDLMSSGKDHDKEIESLLNQVQDVQKLIYIEQIAVKKGFQRKGIAQALLNELTRNAKEKVFGAAVVTKPIANQASFHFFIHHNKWQIIDHIERDSIQAAIIIAS